MVAAVFSVLLASAGLAFSATDGTSSTAEVFRATTASDKLGAAGSDGAGTTVAIIDTGVADVPGLDGALIYQKNISSAPPAGDQFGHGTFVAGLVHRTAPGAKIVSVKLSGANGAVDVTQVLAALQWVAWNRERFSIDVVNLSFGSDSRQSWRTSPLNYGVERLWDQGVVVVASAGNLGGEPGTVTKPADDPVIISVGASDEAGTGHRLSDDTIPTFVSRGPTADGLAKPDLVAPGSHIVSLRAPGSTIDTAHPEARVGEDGFRGSGTSFAAPIAAGVVAQILSANPALTPDQVKFALFDTAHPITGDPAAQGHGSLDAAAASLRAGGTGGRSNAERSTGRGSLDGDRGSSVVSVSVPVSVGGALESRQVPLRGQRTAEVPVPDLSPNAVPVLDVGQAADAGLDSFDAAGIDGAAAWDASQWGASQWGASQWGASQWGASQWGASQWGASQWGASQWWASQWG